MSWLKRSISGLKRQPKRDVSAGVVNQCKGCREIVLQKELEDHFWTCPRCDHHFRIPARTYLDYLVDEGSFERRFELGIRFGFAGEIKTLDGLRFGPGIRVGASGSSTSSGSVNPYLTIRW